MTSRNAKAVGFAVALCLAMTGCGKPEMHKMGPPEVGVVVMKPESATLTTVLPGRTDSYNVSDVRPQVSGILRKRLFVEGSDVKAGQPLYQIDPAPYIATLNNAKAARVTAEAKARRYAALVKLNAVAPQDYDDAEATYKQALATEQSAQINVGYTKVTAPISGRIGRSAFTQGALVTSDQTTALATIQQIDPIYVDINQSSAELLALKLAVQGGHLTNQKSADARVTLVLDNGTAYDQTGTLQFSEVTVDSTTGAVTLRAIFPNPNGLLLPGMFVRATIIEGVQNDAILAPQQGVSHDEKGNATAMIVDSKGFARLRYLTTGQAIGDKWLVTDGLKAGDKLIVEGLQKATPDTQVKAVPASFLKAAKPGGA